MYKLFKKVLKLGQSILETINSGDRKLQAGLWGKLNQILTGESLVLFGLLLSACIVININIIIVFE